MPLNIRNLLKSQWKTFVVLAIAAINLLLILFFTNGGPSENVENLKQNREGLKLVPYKKLQPLELNRYRTTQLYPSPRRKKVPEIRKRKNGPKTGSDWASDVKHKENENIPFKQTKRNAAKRNHTNLHGPLDPKLERPYSSNRKTVSKLVGNNIFGEHGAISSNIFKTNRGLNSFTNNGDSREYTEVFIKKLVCWKIIK